MEQAARPKLIKILMTAPIHAKLLAHHILYKMASRGNNPLCLFPKIKETALVGGVKFSEIKKLAVEVKPFYAHEIASIKRTKKYLDLVLSKTNITYDQFKRLAETTQHVGSLAFATYYEAISKKHIQQAIERSGEYIINSPSDIAYLYIFKVFSNFSELLSLSLDLVLRYNHEYDSFVADLFYDFNRTSSLYWFNSMLKMSNKRRKADEIHIMLLAYLGYSNYFLHLANSSEVMEGMFTSADTKIMEQAHVLYDCIHRLGESSNTFKELTEGIAMSLVDERNANSVEIGLGLLFRF